MDTQGAWLKKLAEDALSKIAELNRFKTDNHIQRLANCVFRQHLDTDSTNTWTALRLTPEHHSMNTWTPFHGHLDSIP
jgi:hypothetical protein